MPLKEISGYTGHKQQRCWKCNQLCSWAYARCSTATNVVALHPKVCQGSGRRYGCLDAHRRNPKGDGDRERHEQQTGTARASKRRRKIAFAHIESGK